MNIEIEFRGIKKGTKEDWIYGGYFSSTDEEGLEHFIFENYHGSNPIYDHTIGQFTGLTDKNGIKIFEGDILEFKNEIGKHKRHKVFRVNGGLVINSHNDDINKDYNPFYDACADMQTSVWLKQCGIIGNIYNNQELLSKI